MSPDSSPKIRVAHVITRFHGAGGAKNTIMTCAGLDKSRFEVDLVVGASADRWRAEGAGVNWIQIPDMIRSLHPLKDWRAARALERLFRARKYTIVHTHLGKAGILGRWAAHRVETPLVIHGLHGATFNPTQTWLENATYLWLEKKAMQWTDKVISVGEDLRDRYLAAGVGKLEDYVIIHSGMDLSAFRAAAELPEEARRAKRRELGLPEDAFVAGYIAALEWRKGHRHLIRVMQILAPRYPQLHLVFAGEGFSADRLKKLVADAGLNDRIHFLGYRNDVPEIMAALHVKLFASEREGLPQVLVQADAVGVPVLAFEAEGVREMVKDGVNGHVFRYGDVKSMAAALERFLQDPELARRMGQLGRAFVDDRWDIATMQRKTQALYFQLLKEKGLL
ncbi:MAG TPA: glycosyltransferase family 1 protein [Anaerolineae bacterium]|nr:glycosyltransferase family 1 protein [Anaerolineae bacterium]